MDLVAEHGARAQSRIRADAAVAADGRAFEMRERRDRGVRHVDVLQHAVRPDAHAVAQRDAALEHATDVDTHVATADEIAAKLEPRRVRDPGSALQQRVGASREDDPLGLDQLGAIVHATHLSRVGRERRFDGHAVGDRHRNRIGQVVLLLRVVRAERRDPARERAGRRGHHAGVDLVKRALVRRGVAVLDDGPDAAGAVAHDATQPTRIGGLRGEKPQSALPRRCDDRGEPIHGHQGTSPSTTRSTPSAGSFGNATRTASPVPRGGSCNA